MKLSDLCGELPIAIQCHDVPDADALASGYALHTYFSSLGREPYFFYGGKAAIIKPNLLKMVAKLDIPVHHDPERKKWDGLLITVDCQYGNNNVQKVEAAKVAVIDHHPPGKSLPDLHLVLPHLGSCATLVWDTLRREGFVLGKEYRKLAIALYYGLYTDTNGFADVMYPTDLNMRDALTYHNPHRMIQQEPVLKTLFSSNMSLKDISIAFSALNAISIDEKRQTALIEAEACDQNVLGYMSDLAIQVDSIDTVIAWTRQNDGWKFSVRTSGRFPKALDVTAALKADGAGVGGGHEEKGGGWLADNAVAAEGGSSAHDFILKRLHRFLDAYDIVEGATLEASPDAEFGLYIKREVILGYIPSIELFPSGARICLRMLEGDTVIAADSDTMIMTGVHGEAYFMDTVLFEKKYERLENDAARYKPLFPPEYEPTASVLGSAEQISLFDRVRTCRSLPNSTPVKARQLTRPTKVFPVWDEETYLLGEPGDWLVAQIHDINDMYVVKAHIFPWLYSPLERDPVGP